MVSTHSTSVVSCCLDQLKDHDSIKIDHLIAVIAYLVQYNGCCMFLIRFHVMISFIYSNTAYYEMKLIYLINAFCLTGYERRKMV